MIERMKDLVRRKDSCVLATTDGETPHCSLMAYVPDPEAEHIFLITSRDTRKYQNLQQHPRVSLLIDTRGGRERGTTQALTVTGTCRLLPEGGEASRIKALFVDRHPHLRGLLDREDIAIVCVRAESLLLLDGPESSHYEVID
jgi:nitroimidazol reductase NimA-like FMN-containing flavoprotein (pyridoxamine 5'-phosphate oxidase superfamily)